jgi:hypothetical protein
MWTCGYAVTNKSFFVLIGWRIIVRKTEETKTIIHGETKEEEIR